MAKELQPFDITNAPDVLRLAEEVRASRVPRLLKSGEEDLAVLSPVEPQLPAGPMARRRTRSANPNDWLLKLADIGADTPPADRATDVSANKYKYVAEAYAECHETGR